MVVPPFLVETMYSHAPDDRHYGLDAAIATQTTRQTLGLVTPMIINMQGECRASLLDEPLPTQLGTNHRWLLLPFLTSYYGKSTGSGIDDAVPTLTTKDRHAVVTPPFIFGYYTRESGIGAALSRLDEPLPTQPTWPVHYLATPGELPQVEDCGFRMLQPHEIQSAMAFPRDYTILGTRREQVKQLGNAVTPPVMKMLIERCVQSLQ